MTTLRRAVTADARAIAAVHRAALWGALPDLRRLHSEAETEKHYSEQVLPTRSTVVAVEANDTVVGFAVLAGDWLEQLHVAPAAQGTGVGGTLLAWAREQRPNGLQLRTFQANARARAFYERAGFTLTETTDGAANEEQEPDARYRWAPAGSLVDAETDLAVLLRGMSPRLNDGAYVYTSVPLTIPPAADPVVVVREHEGLTLVLRREQADDLGLPYDYVAAWITLEIHSALEAVGLTAAVSSALAKSGISANVVAGLRHDHLFVSYADAERAMQALEALVVDGR